MKALEALRAAKLVPVLRARSQDEALRMSESLVSGGIRVLEVTMTVPGAVDLISKLCAAMPADVLIGAGTVLDAETAKKCVDAGAKFVVSPALNLDTVSWCSEHGILCAPGCLTPTEIVGARDAGAKLIKIFPCDTMGGASYIKSLTGPFPDIELMPTGGVNLNTIRSFFEAGAIAVGVGSNLVNPLLTSDQLRTLCEEYMAAI